jgi:1-deoxy-D-xylulose-5-phosphate synthase
LLQNGLLDGGLKFRSLFLPDLFIQHNNLYNMYEEAGLNASGICSTIRSLLRDNEIVFEGDKK